MGVWLRRGVVPAVVAVFLVWLAAVPQETSVVGAQADPDTDVAVCALPVPAGYARCLARVRTDAKVVGKIPSREPVASPNAIGNGGGYDPPFLQSAYNLTAASSSAGRGRTVAIVDAYDAPNAESDLAVYRSRWGLPPCTTANGCFRKANQRG